MKINHEKFEQLLKAAAPYIEFISEMPSGLRQSTPLNTLGTCT